VRDAAANCASSREKVAVRLLISVDRCGCGPPQTAPAKTTTRLERAAMAQVTETRTVATSQEKVFMAGSSFGGALTRTIRFRLAASLGKARPGAE
jgi:hypothetical protein